ncbi:MAG TPA: HAD family hydrolase [Jatrophihabitans sp.]|nr:HAD family hydrolase [Jatrophihabitans sp.]
MSSDSSSELRGVLFDVDGTLVDTTFLHAVCWAEALRQNGQYIPAANLHHAIGMSSDHLLENCVGKDRDTEKDDAIVQAHLTLYKQWWGRLTPLPGAQDLLRHCHERGLRVVLASSAKDEELGALRSALDADDAIDAATSSSDAGTGKPAPDIVLCALGKSGLQADEVVFVGDAIWDGYAAQRAGIEFVGLTCGGTPEAELRLAGAREVWTDPADLLKNFDNSALGGIRQ